MSKQQKPNISVFALGGVGEIGKNMYVIEYGEDILIIDAGLKVPEEDMLGIDVVIPDISYVKENKDRVRGIVVTNGHEGYMGALPYVLRHIQAPVYATDFTRAFIERRMKESGMQRSISCRRINNRSNIRLGQFRLTFFYTTNSIPDSVGVCINTPEGTIVYTGAFKFDYTPLHEPSTDLSKLAEIGQKGVLALLADSTNVEKLGYNRSEKEVGQAILDQFRKARERIIVATYASNIQRIQNVCAAARATGRKVALVGDELDYSVRIARQLNYLEVDEDLFVEPKKIAQMAANDIVVLCSGTHGEPMSALTKMARNTHKEIEIVPGDTVLFAATPIPGNEKVVSRTIDQLYKTGACVVHDQSAIHVSGHAYQEELKLMLNLMQPTYFIPVQGEYRMLRQHGKLAEAIGVPPDNIFLLENGDVVDINRDRARLGSKVSAGNVLIDGLGVGDVGNIVLRDRKLLSQDGILVVVVTLSKKKHTIISGPDIISRGFVYVRESEKLLEDSIRIVKDSLQQCMDEQMNDWSTLKSSVREELGRFLYDQTRRRPMILPIIMEA